MLLRKSLQGEVSRSDLVNDILITRRSLRKPSRFRCLEMDLGTALPRQTFCLQLRLFNLENNGQSVLFDQTTKSVDCEAHSQKMVTEEITQQR